MQSISFEFDVSEPQKKEGGGTLEMAYWVYKISARTNLSQYRNMAMVVFRRYSDFDWLRAQLVLTFPGIIVPPLPEKEISGTLQKVMSTSNNNPLLQYRQRNLRRFLTRVGAHHQLGPSRLLQEFLELSESDWATRMKNPKKSESAGGLASLKKIGMKLSSSISGGAPEVEGPESGLPSAVLEYVKQLETVLNVLKDKLVIYSHRRKESTFVTRDIGKVLIHLGEMRDMYDDTALCKALTEIGSNAMNISAVGVNQSDLELTQLAESVHYYLGMCGAIREVVAAIVQGKSELGYITSELAGAYSTKEKAQAAGNAAKVATQDQTIQTLTTSRDAKTKDIQTLEATFVMELGRVHQEKLFDFQQLLQCFSDIQIEYADKMRKSWESLYPLVRVSDATPLA